MQQQNQPSGIDTNTIMKEGKWFKLPTDVADDITLKLTQITKTDWRRNRLVLQ